MYLIQVKYVISKSLLSKQSFSYSSSVKTISENLHLLGTTEIIQACTFRKVLCFSINSDNRLQPELKFTYRVSVS